MESGGESTLEKHLHGLAAGIGGDLDIGPAGEAVGVDGADGALEFSCARDEIGVAVGGGIEEIAVQAVVALAGEKRKIEDVALDEFVEGVGAEGHVGHESGVHRDDFAQDSGAVDLVGIRRDAEMGAGGAPASWTKQHRGFCVARAVDFANDPCDFVAVLEGELAVDFRRHVDEAVDPGQAALADDVARQIAARFI